MAIKIDQVRYNSNANYLTPIANYEVSQLSETNENSSQFSNRIIHVSLQAGTTYYLRVPIERLDLNTNMGDGVGENDAHRQIIDIKLINQLTDFSQTLEESYTIDPYYEGDSIDTWTGEDNFLNWCYACKEQNVININNYSGADNYLSNLAIKHAASKNNVKDNTDNIIATENQTLELIFTPYRNCTDILFQLRRVTYDYLSDTNRIINFALNAEGDYDLDLAVVNNILPHMAEKIGIQTAPGTLIIINGEGMRVGRSGVLELNCDIKINTVGFAAPLRKIKNFILDYIYTE